MDLFFQGWTGLGRTVIAGVLAYAALVLILRISGKRTLSKMNAFDLVVTVALGSSLSSVLLSKDIPVAEGVLGFCVLIGLQYILAWLSRRFKGFEALIKSEPTLLLYRGHFLERAMRRERVVDAEVLAGIRNQGIANLEGVEAVVLETDGTFSVIRRSDGGADSLRNLEGYPREPS